MAQKAEDDDKVRLDKWLWVARFYKTRALAKAAIESGKVHCRGERCKPGKEPRVGDEFVLRTGFDERTVEATTTRLIGDRGVDKTIAEHDLARGEGRSDDLGDELSAAGREEEWIAERMAVRRNPRGPVERRRQDGRWLIFHEHFSAPSDMESGKALFDLQP